MTCSNLEIYLILPMFFWFVNLLLDPKEGEDARGRGGDGCEAGRGEGRGKGN